MKEYDVMDELARIEAEKLFNEGNFNNGVLDTSSKPPFIMIYNTFTLNPKYTIYQKIVFQGLKSYAGAKVDCFPGKETLAKQLNMSLRKLNDVLKELEELGGILIINRKKESNRKTSNLYILADINITTGEFISNSLDRYRQLKKDGVKVQGK